MSNRLVRFAVMLALVSGTFGVASAQQTGNIGGTVVDQGSGQPISGAQVHIPALGQGQLTNAQGRFLLVGVPAGQQTVRVQIIGYAAGEQTVSVTAGGTVTANFQLKEEAIQVGGLVVTALGVQRQERSLGYAVQGVDEKKLQETPTTNITDALQGKVAGVQVSASSSRPGGSNRVVIRGESSFTGGGQPLYVIDGVPVLMDTENQGGFALEYGQAGSRSMDIDMNNVESINVLRGAAATALYGSRAANGAIIIKTKSGTPGTPTRFTLNSRYEMQNPVLAGYQSTYTAGEDGFYCNGLPSGLGGWCESGYYNAGWTNPTTGDAWGPRADQVDAEVMAHECPGISDPAKCLHMADPRSDFYQTGKLLNTSLNATGGLPNNGAFNLQASYVTNDGIEPYTSLKRLNLNANVTLQLTQRLQSTTTVMYANTDNVWQTEGWNSIEQELWYRTPNLDVRKAWNADGTPVMWGSNTPHPEWVTLHSQRDGKTGRWIASQYFKFDILPNLNLSNRLGYDVYNENRVSNDDERPWRTAAGLTSGSSAQERFGRSSLNDDVILTLTGTQLNPDFNISGLAGFNLLARENNALHGNGSDIIIPQNYNLNNFSTTSVRGDLTEKRRLLGAYGQATLGYRDWAFLNLTGRNDWSSTLPKNANNYFYPSASLGVVFTDALGIRNKWLDYGKIRVSYAKVGSDAPPYTLATTYGNPNMVNWPFDGTQGFLQDNSLGNPILKPESTKEYEVGLEMRGINGRASLNTSYYDKKSYDQIFSVPSSSATGYSSIVRNAGNLKNQGWEVTAQFVPVQTPKMRWDLNLNWTKNKSTVMSLAPGVSSIYLAGYSWPNVQIMEGRPYGVIWGNGFARSPDGQVIIDDNPSSSTYGWPVMADTLMVLGETQPHWLGNVYSSFRYGPFTLSGIVSTVQGGDVFNFTLNYTVGRGVQSWTLGRGSSFVYPGVKESDGSPNDITVTRDRNYYRNELGGYLRSENNVESGTATRLQELTLQYQLPRVALDAIGVSSAQLYVTGHNLHVWTNFSMGDPQGSNYGDTNAAGQYYHMFTSPMLRTYSFGLRANF